MGSQGHLGRFGQPPPIVGMQSKQRLARFDSVADLFMNEDADSVIHYIRLLRAARPQEYGCLAYAARMNLRNAPVSMGFYQRQRVRE